MVAVAATAKLSPPVRVGNIQWFANRGFAGECPYHHLAESDQENLMVALNEQFHHNGTPSRLQGSGAGQAFSGGPRGVRNAGVPPAPPVVVSRQDTRPQKLNTGIKRDGESVEVLSDHGPQATDQKFGSSDGLFIDHCSLVFERSAGANEVIFCGYRYDPETELYYVRNRIVEAIGPETFTYRELVEVTGKTIGCVRPIVSVNPVLGYSLVWLMGKFVGNVIITRDEIRFRVAVLSCVYFD